MIRFAVFGKYSTCFNTGDAISFKMNVRWNPFVLLLLPFWNALWDWIPPIWPSPLARFDKVSQKDIRDWGATKRFNRRLNRSPGKHRDIKDRKDPSEGHVKCLKLCPRARSAGDVSEKWVTGHSETERVFAKEAQKRMRQREIDYINRWRVERRAWSRAEEASRI